MSINIRLYREVPKKISIHILSVTRFMRACRDITLLHVFSGTSQIYETVYIIYTIDVKLNARRSIHGVQ
jgi:hypothetical protein